MLIDLQLHSTYSDGYLAPTAVAKFIAGKNIKVAALTDHNTVGGLDEFHRACAVHDIKTISGVEIYVRYNHTKFNLIWFNFDDKHPDLHKLLRNIQRRRRGQVRRMLKKLVNLGFQININKVVDKYNHYIPINKIAADVNANKFNAAKIKKIIGKKAPREEDIIRKIFKSKDFGILRESYVSLQRILDLRKKIGGQIVINHPGKYGINDYKFFKKMKKLGVDGIDVLSPHHSIGAIMYLQQLASDLDFIVVGSSDFHLHEGKNFLLQNSWDYFKVDSAYLKGINKIIG